MTYSQFLALFPNLEPPLTLTEDSIFAFSKHNKLISPETARQFFEQFESDYVDNDEVEYIPCFSLSLSGEFHTLIYWRASTLLYEYYLITINKQGQLIDRRLIGGLLSKNNGLLRMVTSIDINCIFYIVASLVNTSADEKSESQSYSLEILPDGTIISS